MLNLLRLSQSNIKVEFQTAKMLTGDSVRGKAVGVGVNNSLLLSLSLSHTHIYTLHTSLKGIPCESSLHVRMLSKKHA